MFSQKEEKKQKKQKNNCYYFCDDFLILLRNDESLLEKQCKVATLLHYYKITFFLQFLQQTCININSYMIIMTVYVYGIYN